MKAIIGYTGFVGSNICAQSEFDDFFNSKNIQEIEGKTYDLLVCSGVSAVKWLANQNPEDDFRAIESLKESLKKVSATKFVLISTVDIYPYPVGVNESSLVSFETNHSYGKHRYMFEQWIQQNFSSVTIIRLPGLFGNGLKKNIIYDLLHQNSLENIILNSSYQYYPLANIWRDIEISIQSQLPIINFATEPIITSEIISRFFPSLGIGKNSDSPPKYDFHTQHASLFNKEGVYMMSKQEALDSLSIFIRQHSLGN